MFSFSYMGGVNPGQNADPPMAQVVSLGGTKFGFGGFVPLLLVFIGMSGRKFILKSCLRKRMRVSLLRLEEKKLMSGWFTHT